MGTHPHTDTIYVSITNSMADQMLSQLQSFAPVLLATHQAVPKAVSGEELGIVLGGRSSGMQYAIYRWVWSGWD